jgi:hypothetical protein
MNISKCVFLFVMLYSTLGCDHRNAEKISAPLEKLYVDARNVSPFSYLNQSTDISGNIEVNLAAVLSQRCPKVTLTRNRESADYTMSVQYQLHQQANNWNYPGSIVLTDHHNDVVYTTLSSSVLQASQGLSDVADAVCKNQAR